jgi:sulfite reductase alpha subunit-like flavoprotein
MGGVDESIFEAMMPRYCVSLALASPDSFYSPCPPRFRTARVTSNDVLSQIDSGKLDIHLVRLNIEGSSIRYHVGQHLLVLPRNPEDVVDSFLEQHHLNGKTHITVSAIDHGMPFLTLSL